VTAVPTPGSGRTVVRLTSAETHDLRLRVLRDGTPSTDVTYAQDDLPTTIHLGVLDEAGVLRGVSSWAVEPWPGEPTTSAVRLRGMAVEQTLQGGGYGRVLVDAGVDWARDTHDVGLIWATARDAVLAFYERCGFAVVGDGFVDATTALPHHTVVRRFATG